MTEQEKKRYISRVEELLDREIDSDYRQEEAKQLSLPKEERVKNSQQPYLFFRLSEERFAVPAKNLNEITPLKEIHKIPYKKNKALQGVTTIHGRLQIALSLHELLEVQPSSQGDTSGISSKRMIVLEKDDRKWVVTVDEVYRFHRLDLKEMENVPVNVMKAKTSYLSGVINWKGVRVGLLDPDKLFQGLESILL